ncbi:dynactin subunit 6-like [Hydra vulgaris]|uniref:Dynactin subunit 6 n=1 Tax=Hydra vulgaris TaxID=6087 RepID=A0ABM4C9C5_HYDVU
MIVFLGSIVIGDGNLIEEQVTIINTHPGRVLVIGHCNVFEIGAHVEAISIDSNNVFEAKTFIGPNVVVTDGCVVGAICRLTGKEKLTENIVIYGEKCSRRIAFEKTAPQILQLDFLAIILPNYHHMKVKSK